MGRDISLTSELQDYILNHMTEEPALFKGLIKETEALGHVADMQISWVQAQFMRSLLTLLNAKITVEVGVFTGYSTLVTALSLPDDGKIYAFDIHKEWTDIAKSFWEKAGVSNKIDLTLGEAEKELQTLLDKGLAGKVDFMFIDADKPGMLTYANFAEKLLRKGDLLLADNVLWSGDVLDKKDDSKNTVAIREFNAVMKNDTRFIHSLIPVGDGLSLFVKK